MPMPGAMRVDDAMTSRIELPSTQRARAESLMSLVLCEKSIKAYDGCRRINEVCEQRRN